MREVHAKLEEMTDLKKGVETKFRSTEKRLKTVRDDNNELEKKLARKCEFATQLETKLKNKEAELKSQQTEYQILLQHLDSWTEMRVKQVEEFSDMHANSANVCDKLKSELIEIEKTVSGRTRMLENTYLPVVLGELSVESRFTETSAYN